jgi:hypothetical protein
MLSHTHGSHSVLAGLAGSHTLPTK